MAMLGYSSHLLGRVTPDLRTGTPDNARAVMRVPAEFAESDLLLHAWAGVPCGNRNRSETR